MAMLAKASLAGIAPMIISFSELEGVKEWIKQTNCPFPVYIDAFRATYAAFGLKRSMKAFGLQTMHYYGQKVAAGEELPSMHIQEDTAQLGGDFTVDCASKKMVFLYPSKSAADRPTLDAIVNSIQH